MTTSATTSDAEGRPEVDVLIVGAGPTGLTLAAQLQTFGTTFRVIDRVQDRARESRALGIQARSLEVLQSLGLGDRLVAAGRSTTLLAFHFEDRVARGELGGFRAPGTRYPFILFLSQAETERIFNEHLAARGVEVERGVELVEFTDGAGGVNSLLRRDDGREERVRARYLIGCDGAHSTVRRGAGIPFEGGTYLQPFALGDVEAEGPLQVGAINGFLGRTGIALFFPLGSPRTWRVIAMAPDRDEPTGGEPMTSNLDLAELQGIVDGATNATVRLRDPEWITLFRLHHRQTAKYRSGNVFLAGDAAHIHSPVGAQGMNTGIQDSWNLGWKIALVAKGWANEALLDSYEEERWPVGHVLLRTTDRFFSLLTRTISAGPAVGWIRRAVMPRVLPRVLRSESLRGYAFGFISELRIRYRKSSAVTEGVPPLPRGPRAGDRLPDAVVVREGRETHLQQELVGPRLNLLLCGDPDSWDGSEVSRLETRYGGLLVITTLVRTEGTAHLLLDPTGEAFSRLGVTDLAQYLVRPDGYIAYRCAGGDLTGVGGYLERWFSGQ